MNAFLNREGKMKSISKATSIELNKASYLFFFIKLLKENIRMKETLTF